MDPGLKILDPTEFLDDSRRLYYFTLGEREVDEAFDAL
jgi:hypothetical protein